VLQPPKTVKGYVTLLRMLNDVHVRDMKGYGKRTGRKKIALINICSEIEQTLKEFP